MTTLTSPCPTRHSTTQSTPRTATKRLTSQDETRSSHELATSFLVRGCERALFDLRCSLGPGR